jgi:ABC-type branched-subunit amino acid transport system substrate-binding protein
VLVAASCSSKDNGTGASTATTAFDVAAALGPSNKATGTPIKIGLVDDGKTIGIDHTPVVGAFNATVQYVNEHRGGLNGHVIEVDECSTNNTPADATNCGIKMVNDKVAAVLVPVSAQDTNVFNAMSDSGIPYFTYTAGSPNIILKAGAFVLTNSVAGVAAPAKMAKEANVKKAGIIVIDVPAATGPLAAIAKPVYAKAGVDLSVVAISPQTADMTPQIQEAIGSGAEQFTVIGTDEFNTAGIKALKQLGFTGKIVMVTAPSQSIVDNVPGGLDGVAYITSDTGDQNDPDVKLYNAVVQTYMSDITPVAQSTWAFATVLSFVNALKDNASAVDAPTVAQALRSMPKPLPLPLGAGLTYQCGAKPVALVPNVCTPSVLETTLDAQGKGATYATLDVTDYVTLGG